MDPSQPVVPAQPVAQGQPAPVQPVAQQPIVNTDALKAQAGNLANNAKAGVNTFVEKVKTDKGVMIGAIVGIVTAPVQVIVGVLRSIICALLGCSPKAVHRPRYLPQCSVCRQS